MDRLTVSARTHAHTQIQEKRVVMDYIILLALIYLHKGIFCSPVQYHQ